MNATRGRLPPGLLAALMVFGLSLSARGLGAEEEVTPSQNMKKAIESFSKTPALVGEKLEAATRQVKKAVREALGGKAAAKAEKEDRASPERPPRPARPPYAPSGRRDPFRPPAPATDRAPPRENLSPLERLDLAQLKLVGIVWNAKEPHAMVEDSSGLGYTLRVGTPIGAREGRVKAIRPGEVVIEETVVDFYGARKKRETVLRLPAE
jgi:Tfp pilus assembly protein PilP